MVEAHLESPIGNIRQQVEMLVLRALQWNRALGSLLEQPGDFGGRGIQQMTICKSSQIRCSLCHPTVMVAVHCQPPQLSTIVVRKVVRIHLAKWLGCSHLSRLALRMLVGNVHMDCVCEFGFSKNEDMQASLT